MISSCTVPERAKCGKRRMSYSTPAGTCGRGDFLIFERGRLSSFDGSGHPRRCASKTKCFYSACFNGVFFLNFKSSSFRPVFTGRYFSFMIFISSDSKQLNHRDPFLLNTIDIRQVFIAIIFFLWFSKRWIIYHRYFQYSIP